jgi:hypothetical protein
VQCVEKNVTTISKPQKDSEDNQRRTEISKGKSSMTEVTDDSPPKYLGDLEPKNETTESSQHESPITKEIENISLENRLMIPEDKIKKTESWADIIIAAIKQHNTEKNKKDEKKNKKHAEQYVNKKVYGRYDIFFYVKTCHSSYLLSLIPL